MIHLLFGLGTHHQGTLRHFLSRILTRYQSHFPTRYQNQSRCHCRILSLFHYLCHHQTQSLNHSQNHFLILCPIRCLKTFLRRHHLQRHHCHLMNCNLC
jgi:hypothetical protein